MTESDLHILLRDVLSLPSETEWVEFKHNNADPVRIGEYLSALSNSAALHRKECGYLVWGVENATGNPLVGTSFDPYSAKIGNEPLEPWLARSLSPRINFEIHVTLLDGKNVVLICVQPATSQPVAFKNIEFIRVGSCNKAIKDYPERERALWAMFSSVPFERGIAATGVSSEHVLNMLDYPVMFELLKHGLPENRAGILERMTQEKIIVRRSNDRFDITNIGAILFGKSLSAFERIARKALRVIVYKGTDRIDTIRERGGDRGYAIGFSGAIRFINEQLPQNEQIGQALRRETRMFPEIAIRELVANALVHQDFNLSGTGPMVEIFVDRMEITNPGTPLIDTLRFIDEPPHSRNEAIAAMMRRMRICEERGSGIDKVVANIELYQLPAPSFTRTQEHTKATMFAYKKLSQMDKDDRVRACYQHACLQFVSNKRMTNATIRSRFGIEDKNYPMASRIINETIGMNLVKPYDPSSTSKKHASYVPFWG